MEKSAEEKELVVNINYEMFVLALVVLSLVNWMLIVIGRLATGAGPGRVDHEHSG